jgi:aerobic-type carbon monoxide dehydrogenase small subunit (CoxS/CutS family)
MSAIPIINADRKYSRDEIKKWIAGNFCRCTGYQKIVMRSKRPGEAVAEKGLLK